MRHRWLALGGCVLMSAVVCAHDVPVEQRVEMTVQPQGDRLTVRMHVPVTALGDARLPRLPDGTLDPARIDGPLQIVSAEVVRNLDMQQDETALSAPVTTATLGADRASVDLELTYRVAASANGISARLNGFQGTPMQPVRTTVRYQPAAGGAQVVSVTGPAARVRFDPGMLEALQLSITRGLSSVLTLGDHLLLLVCVLLPLRSTRDAIRLFTALAAGQVAGIVIFLLSPGGLGAWAAATSMVAASAVVVATVQNIVRARLALVGALACGFGFLNGFAFGDAFTALRQLAGAHQAVAFAAFLAMVIAGQLWLAGVLWATRTWLDRRGVPDRVLVIGVSALIAHTAVHEAIYRSNALATTAPLFAERALVWLTLGWAVVMLIVAAFEAMRQRRISIA